MRQIGSIIFICIFLLILAATAGAVMGPQGVSKTPHNLSSSSGWIYVADNEDEICIFCHTPHGGSLDGPLWNRESPLDNDPTAFTHYTTATLNSVTTGASRALSDESLLCMSCHDGAMAVNHVLNPSNGTGGQPTISGGDQPVMDFGPGIIGGRIGKSRANETSTRDLTDDHPISFSYDDVRAAYTTAGKGSHLHDVSSATTAGVRFFGGTNRVECASCHDPHVNYDATIPAGDPTADENYRPFLIMPNTGSAMCLACHNK